MFTAEVYKVMVGSLSGAMKEVYSTKETIRNWNHRNSECSGKVFMPVDWRTRIDEIRVVDVVVGIIDNWIENPEFISDCIDAGKQVLLFFNTLPNPNNTIPSEWKEIEIFRNKIQTRCYCASFNGLTELCSLLDEQLGVI